MSNVVTGNVVNIFKDPRVSKAGKQYDVWRVEINTPEGRQVFDIGLTHPTAYNIGDAVTLNWDMKYGKPTIVDAPTQPTNVPKNNYPSKQGTYGNKGKPFPLPRNHGDTAIIRQNALTNAREMVMAMYAAVPAPEADMSALVDNIIEVAYTFAEFSSGQREERIAREMQEAPIGAMNNSNN
jgi:hypothetical protein